MTSTTQTYVGNGAQTDFSFSFDYLRKEFVKVFIDGVDTPSFTFHTAYTLRITPAPAVGKVVLIRRVTDRTRLVEFVDGSILGAVDLNLSALQAIHIAAEALDAASGSLLLDETGAYSAGFRRIALVGAPVNPKDVATKEWAESGMTSQLVLAAAEKTAAAAEKTAAVAAKLAAEAARDAAAAHVITAGSEADASEASATAAAGSAATALTRANTASTHATTATTQAGIATTKAGEAAASAVAADASADAADASAVAAAASAALASGLDPASYVKKVDAAGIGDISTATVADLNAITLGGIYGASSSTVGVPTAHSYRVLHLPGNTTGGCQLAVRIDNSDVYIRTRNGSTTWGAWQLLQDNLGFTPAQQGGGSSMGTNKVYIGWDSGGAGIRAQIDTTPMGFLALRSEIPAAVDVMGTIAAQGHGAVGTYALLGYGASTISLGATYAGSGLAFAGMRTAPAITTSGGAASGTWRSMGQSTFVTSGGATVALFLRIS